MKLALFLAGALGLASATAEVEFQCAHCAAIAKFAAEDKSGQGVHRKYAPDRLVDISHLKLEVTPDFETRSIEATATLDFQPIAKPLAQLTLNAVGLTVLETKGQHAIAGTEVSDENIVVTFQQPIPADQKSQLTIRYRVEPKEGLYFRTEAMGYPKGDTQLWTQGEPESHRHWFPSHDYPNEKFTTEVICHVPEGMTAMSNGKLVEEKKSHLPGKVAFHWLQDKPHVNYLISLVAGYFHKLEDKLRDVPVAIFVPPSEKDQAANSFRDTKKILEYFEQEIGVPYPWDKYYNICAIDYMMGGMENTSITTLTVRTLFPNEVENLRSSRGLDAHEAAHQWFGDLVTCKDWSHLWLNEGFATYYSSLYEGHADGADYFKHDMLQKAEQITSNANDTIPIVHTGYDKPMEQFSFRAYPKGAWVLHMLRTQLGADLFRKCIKTYLERNRYETVATQDLHEVIEELSGRSFSQFFDQWVYLSGTPELKVSYDWNDLTKQAKVTIAQTQAISEKRPMFRFPLPIRFKRGSRVWDETVEITDQSEEFYFTLEEAPEIARIDPEVTVLAKINFEPPKPMIMAQLADGTDAIGRLLAAKLLAKDPSRDSIAALRKTLNEDAFFAARIEAADALAAIQKPEAVEALAASTSQADARARQAVLNALGRFYENSAANALAISANQETNPMIRGQAVRHLARYARPESRNLLLRVLQTPSYQQGLADAAIDAMRSQDDPFYIDPILRELERTEAKFPSGTFGQGLGSLARLARNEEDKTRVREFLVARVDSAKEAVATGAIRALGELRDAKALPVLEALGSAEGESAKTKAAREAAGKLRETKPVAPEEVATLRNEVFELQRQLKSMSEDLKSTKAQFQEAIGALRKAEEDDKTPAK